MDNVIEEVIDKIKSSKVDAVHLSFDIDVLDKELVPGTGTP
ncbi:MAG: arginase, partial [Tissierellia bacterium]|nr:arginase [Tissierellia bacterium]